MGGTVYPYTIMP